MLQPGKHFEIVGDAFVDREAWLAARKFGIGASEMPIVLGLASWSSPTEMWALKLGLVEPQELNAEIMLWGNLLEPVILAEFARRTGRAVAPSQKLIRSIEHPWALATLDAMTSTPEAEAAWPLEVKTTGAWRAEEWAEGPPPRVMAQVQQQLLVTGAPLATVACLIGGQRLVWCDVERDDRWQQRIAREGEAFWRCVTSGTPPPVDGSPHTRAALSSMFRDVADREALLPASLIDVADELCVLRARGKVDGDRKAELENVVRAELQTACAGWLPDGRGWTWRANKSGNRTLRWVDRTNKENG